MSLNQHTGVIKVKKDVRGVEQERKTEMDLPVIGKEYRKPELTVHAELKDATGFSGQRP